ncbi:MAG: flavodoxin family protein [Candidatus Gastranaerophilales bacterium]|nr:flavodoxin family protein [Candidatus Gastranaerophilales bacterium]
MKVLLINGSPHKNGCTTTALAEIEKTLKEEKILCDTHFVGTDPISCCRGCAACGRLGRCVIDDEVNGFLEYAAYFDGYIIAAPVHCGSASGNIVPFLDRVFYVNYMSGRKIFEHKPGAAVTSARRAGTTTTLDQLNKYFMLAQMPIISGRYWNIVHGMSAEQAKLDLEGMQNMRILARNMAWTLKCIEAGEKAGIKPPKTEELIHTNFIRLNS